MTQPEWWLRWTPVLTRYGALCGVAWETLVRDVDRPYLLALFGAMLGLGEVAAAWRIKREGPNEGS